MNTRKILSLAAVTLVGALGFGSTAVAANTAPTDVNIKGQEGDYFGKVSSPEKNCLENREVTVYKQVGSKPDRKDDRKIGTDLTDKKGNWSAGNTGYKKGKFYAFVKPYSLVALVAYDKCDSAQSDVISR